MDEEMGDTNERSIQPRAEGVVAGIQLKFAPCAVVIMENPFAVLREA